MKIKNTKVVIVGAGNVGSTIAYTMINQELCEELVLIDMNKEKALGEVLDLQHSIYFMNRNTRIKCGDYKECENADVVIITAAAPMNREANDRLTMLAPSKQIMKNIIASIMENNFNGILLVISNPVDIMTYYAWKLSGLPANQVIGSGTTLDTARLCTKLSDKYDLDSKDVSVYVVGEHGDSEVVLWDSSTIGGKKLIDVMNDNKNRSRDETFDKLRSKVTKSGWEIFHRKGNTSYGVAASVTAIVKSILYNENKIFPVSTYLNNQYSLNNIYISVPAIVGKNGIKEIVEINLIEEEKEKLLASADAIKCYYEFLND